MQGKYEAIGSKIQESKVLFYYWRWEYINGMQWIVSQEANITVYNKNIDSIPINTSIRMLGVYLNPTLNWKSQFEVMRGKISKKVSKSELIL